MVNSYSYMKEAEIDDELKCAICHQPFQEPVNSALCNHTFCKECIIACINRERCCPLYRRFSTYEHYRPVGSHALLNQLNRLRVYCDACQERNIERSNFEHHKQTCPKWVIPCTAADIRCGWQGMRNQLANHVRICPFQSIRPIVDDLRGQIESHSRQIKLLQDGLYFLFVIFGGFALIVFYMWQKEEPSRQSHNLRGKLQGLFS